MKQTTGKLWSCFIVLTILLATICIMTLFALAEDQNESRYTYSVTIGKCYKCTVIANCKEAEPRVVVGLTLVPDFDDYVLHELKVTDDDQNEIPVRAGTDGMFFFTMPKSNVTVSAEFGYPIYDITVNRTDVGSTENCQIMVDKRAEEGDRVLVDITLASGSSLASLEADGDNTGNSYKMILKEHREGSNLYHYYFEMPPEPVTVSVVFSNETYPIMVGESVVGKTEISVDGNPVTEARPGEMVTVTSTTPDHSLNFDLVRYTFTEKGRSFNPVVDGSSVRGDKGFVFTGTFRMQAAPVTIEAEYQKPFVIVKDPKLEGIYIDTNMKSDRAAAGDVVTVEAASSKVGSIPIPDEWDVTYTDSAGSVKQVKVTRDKENPNMCTFTMPDGDVNVNMKGIQICWILTINEENCTAAVDKRYPQAGETVTVTIDQSDNGRNKLYVTASIYENNESVELKLTRVGVNKFTFIMPEQSVTLTAQYGLLYLNRYWFRGHLAESIQACAPDYQVFEGSYDKEVVLDSGWYLVDGSKGYTKDGNPTCNKLLTISGDVKLVLTDGKQLNARDGIYIRKNSKLTIYEEYGKTGSVAADATLKDGWPGIGGSEDLVGGDLVIKGGNITAIGDTNAAGIGGGNHKSGMGDITIYGGTVEAHGGSSGAGIGRGQQNNNFGTLTIYGGTVIAEGGSYAAGIGGGEDRGGIDVHILGGNVTATGGEDGAGIGGGEGGSGATVNIEGGFVTTKGGKNGAGIGGGQRSGGGGDQGDTIKIENALVRASGGDKAAGIGGGEGGKGGEIQIIGADVTATGGERGAGIGGGSMGDGGSVKIENSTVAATGGFHAAGIGGGDVGAGGSFTMLSGTVTAEGGGYAAGVGGGNTRKGGDVTISGGTLTAIGNIANPIGSYQGGGAGIGGGADGDGGKVIIENEDTVVNAIGSPGAAGIGGGYQGKNKEVIIYGGTVTATAGDDGVGIGGGHWGDGGLVTIYGGKVCASAGNGGKAIGHTGGGGTDGTLTLDPAVSVKSGNDKTGSGATLCAAADRVNGCRSLYALIEPCAHSECKYIITLETHMIDCPNCSSEQRPEIHLFDEKDGKCMICGAQSGQTSSVSSSLKINRLESYIKDSNAARAQKETVKSVKVQKGRKAVLIWKPIQGVSGYEIACSTSINFTKKTTKKVIVKVTANSNPTKAILKNLKARKKYFVRVRPYTKIQNPITGETEKICGKWSGTKKFRAKK